MIKSLQNSNVEACKYTSGTFYVSIVFTMINLLIRFVMILKMALNKVFYGDLVIADMKKQFEKYLLQLKDKQSTSFLMVNDDIEFWPKMIKPLYLFMLENEKYEEIVFGEKVKFKGSYDDYLTAFHFLKF